MAICYREIHKLDLIADMYENAHKKRPDNEEILTAMFMAYVRLGNHKKQQQTAMTLHKLKPNKNPYYFWAIMSIVMQARNCTDKNLAQKMFLPLAERMTKKFVDEGKVEAEAEVQMYLIILELMEKWEDALNVLEGPLSEKLVSELNFKETKSTEFYTKLGRWKESNIAYRKLLCSNRDHMYWWREYINSALKLEEEKWLPPDDSKELVDYTGEKALSFIKECQEKDKGSRQERGPYLAHLELIKQAQKTICDPCRIYGDPVELLENYYIEFGDKFCCFSDLRAYLDILNTEEQSRLVECIMSKNQYKESDGTLIYVENIKQMQRHITCLQLCRCMSAHVKLTKDEKLELARELVDRHKNGLKFGKELLTTDLQFCDSYLLLAVALLLDVWQNHGENSLVWQIIVLLELGMKESPSSFQMKLLLIRLYCTMGAFGPCPALYDGMEIKYIMNDTLGHIVSNHVGRLGHFSSACAMYGTMLRFFTFNHKETAEYLIASYKFGSFTKIDEFVRFRDRLQHSLQYASATAERMLLDLVLETNSHVSTEQMIMYMEIDPAQDKTDFDALRDNRNFSVILSWDPTSICDVEKAKQHSYREEVAWLKIRNLTLRILAASVMLGQEIDHDHQMNNGLSKDGKQPIHNVLYDLKNKLSQHVQNCHEQFSQEYKYPIQGPFRTRLSTFLQGNYFPVFLEMLENVTYVHSLQDIDIDKIDDGKEERLKTSVTKMLKELLEKNKVCMIYDDNNCKSINPDIIENMVLLSEAISHLCVLFGVCYRMLKPVKTVLSRRNKKKKENILPIPCTFDNYNTLVKDVEKVCQEIHKTASELDPVFLSLDLSSLNLSQPFQDNNEYAEMEKEMWKSIEVSYQQSFVEITEFLHKKLQYLSGLHL
ncbi:N-alpha-acetyltransferase 25 [Mactra antiquata]